MIPKLNKVISDSGGYIELLKGTMFDAALQADPVVDVSHLGFEMTGLFSPINGTDLDPKDLEKNLTTSVHLDSVFDQNGANLQFYLH